MVELIYPYGTAPEVPAPSAGAEPLRPDSEWFPIVLPSGLVVGRSTREYCHSGAMPLHPVVHLHIIDRFSRIYLQKRSMLKDIQPGKWDTAVGGHVSYGESIFVAVYGVAAVVLGLFEFFAILVVWFELWSGVVVVLVNIFAAVGSYELRPDRDEVDEGKWWELAEIDAAMGQGVFTPNFESEFAMIRNQLLALL